jgi:hypothetical protein
VRLGRTFEIRLSATPWLDDGRSLGGDRDHRNSGRPAAAGCASGAGVWPTIGLRKQPQANRQRSERLPGTGREISGGRQGIFVVYSGHSVFDKFDHNVALSHSSFPVTFSPFLDPSGMCGFLTLASPGRAGFSDGKKELSGKADRVRRSTIG